MNNFYNSHGQKLKTIFEIIEDKNNNGNGNFNLKHSLTEEIKFKKISLNNNLYKNSEEDDRIYNNLKIYQVSKILAHKDQITSISLSSDASKILTSTKDKTSKIQEVKTGQNILNISEIRLVILAQFHENKKQILFTSLDSKIYNTPIKVSN